MTTPAPLPAHSAPGPRGHFVFGTIREAWHDPLNLFVDATRDYGDVVHFRFGWWHYLLLNDAQVAHRVLIENAKNYHKSPNYQGLKTLLGDGLLTAEGDLWRRQRKLSQPAFHRESLAGLVETMTSCVRDAIARWSRSPGSESVDVHEEMVRLTFRIIGKAMLGADLEHEAKDAGEALSRALSWADRYVESIIKLPPRVPTRRNRVFTRDKRFVEDMLMRVVSDRRRTKEQRHDLLGMLMNARDETTDEPMSDRQLQDELLTLVLAGHETTANAMSFTLHLLSRNPLWVRRLRAEVDAVLGDRDPGLSDLGKLPVLRAIIDESLRLYPPAWIVERVSLAPDVLGGYSIPAGFILGISPYAMHRNRRYFENPEAFDPGRFLTPDEGRPRLAYLPFGGGPRTCIGNAFALMELQVALAMIVRAFDHDLSPGFRLTLDASITLRPAHGLLMNRRPRSKDRPSS